MIKFEFTVEDHEAEAIFDALNEERVKCIQAQLEFSGDLPKKHWFKERSEYLARIIEKMHNKRV